MADENKDLIFPMHLDIDVQSFEKSWKEAEPQLQAILDINPLKAKLDVDLTGLQKSIELFQKIQEMSMATGKNINNTTGAIEGSLKEMQDLSKRVTSAAFDLPISGNTKVIDELIIKSRNLSTSVKELSNAALPLKDILSIGGKTPTGLQLKTMRDELQRFISAEKEGSAEAVIANEKLLAVKERIRNMYGKQESALKATDEEKKINETISAYKRLESELMKINARVRTRASIESGKIIPTSGVSVSTMGTANEAAIYKEISAAMDRYKASLSAANQERLKATPLESAKREIDLNNQNLSIQNKISKNIAQQSALWQRYDQILQKPEATITQINSKLNQLANLRPKLNMDKKQVDDVNATVSNLQTRLAALKIPSGSLSAQFSALNKQWSALTMQERTGVKGQTIITQYQKLTTEAGRAAGTLKNAAKEQDKLTAASDKATKSINYQTDAHKRNMGVMNGVKQFTNSYISILGAYRLGQNIVDTTAEFEMQRVALAAIIQNKQKADELFSQNVELGLQSPFQIKELITYTKQLAAYRVETDQLFDTTKRLADISSGLGVGMDRLVLAYGQVRAASVLRGQELRQFTEAGIPLVSLLADKFTKLNGVATSTSDVFKLISQRAVSFEMVKEVFDDMTNAGGTFYRMQEIQAETLKGSLSNLKDAYQKMFMQMGNANMGVMKSIIDGIKELMSNWRVIGEVATDVAVGYGVAKLAILAYNAALGKENAMNIASIMAAKKKEAALIRQSAAYKKLSIDELRKIATTKMMTMADWQQLVTDKKLTGEMALRMVAMKKMTVEQAKAISGALRMTEADIMHAAAMKRSTVIRNMAIVSLKAFAASAITATKALLSNPLTWWVVILGSAIKGITSLAAYNRKYNDLQKESIKLSRQYSNEITEAYEGIRGTVEKGIMVNADEKAIISARSALQQIIEKNEQLKPLVESRLANLITEAEKLAEIKKIWEEIKTATADGGINVMPLNVAQKGTGGWLLNKDIVQNSVAVNEAIDKINYKMSEMSGRLGLATQDLRKQFDMATRGFKNGGITLEIYSKYLKEGGISLGEYGKVFKDEKISLENYSKALSNIYSTVAKNKNALKPGTEKDAWDSLMGKIMKAQFHIGFLGEDVKKFYKSIAREYKLNEDKLNFGLTPEKFNQFQTQLALMVSSWTGAFSDIEKAGLPVLNNVINKIFRVPFLPDNKTKTNTDAAYYNKLLAKYKLTNIPKLTDEDLKNKEITEETISETISNTLRDQTAILEKYNKQVDAGNLINKESIPSLKEKVRQYKLLNELYGGGETEKHSEKTDPRIAILKDQVSLIEEAYKKYVELSALIGKEKAKGEVIKQYGGQNKPISGITKTGLPLVFSQGELNAAQDVAITGFKKMGEEGIKAGRDAFRKQADSSFDEMKRTIQTNLDKLAADIEQTQRANEFYEKMLGLTGSKDAAEKLTKAMGMTVGDTRKDMQKALGATMKVGGVDYGAGVNLTDVNAVQKAIKKMREAGLKASADSAQKQLDILVDYKKKQLEEIYSGLEDYMTAQEKKVKIAAETQRRIKQIEDDENLIPEEKAKLINIQERGLKQEYGKIDIEELQKTDEYIRAFEDLSRVGGATLDSLYTDLERLSKQTGLSATDLKTIKDLMEKIRLQKESANPFEAWSEGITKYKQAIADLDLYSVMPNSNEYKAAQDLLMDGVSKMESAAKNIQTAFQTTTSPLEKTISLIEEVADGLGLAFSDDTKDLIDSFMKGFKIMSDAMEVANSILALNTMVTNINTASKVTLTGVNAGATASEVALAIGAQGATVSFGQLAVAIWAALAPLWPLLLAGAALGAIFAIINAEAKKQEKIQEALTKKIKALDEAYQQLERSAERAVGSDYLKKMQEQRINLLEREKIALEKARTVRDKKGRIDGEKSLEYYKEAVKYRQEADDLVEEIRQKLTGYSYVAEAASDFSSAWLDAYISFENTADAINDKFKEMINKMIVESFLASIIAKELKPVFDAIDEAFKDGQITAEELKNIDNLTATATIAIDAKSQAGMEALRRGGIDVRASKESLSGISASVASMSEDTANTLGGYFNSGLMQWVKQTGLQTQILAAIQAQDVKTPLANMYKLQQESLATINAIKADTAIMVSRLNTLVENQNSTMISGGQKAVNVRLLN